MRHGHALFLATGLKTLALPCHVGAEPAIEVRLRLLDTIILPMLLYRASSWAPSVQLLDEVARFQRRCVARASVVPMFPLEDPIAYCRRRGRAAGGAVRGRVQWADQVLRSATVRLNALREELRQGPGGRQTWTATLVAYRDAAWLATRRIESGCASTDSGRMGIRVSSGRMAPRFEGSVLRATRIA